MSAASPADTLRGCSPPGSVTAGHGAIQTPWGRVTCVCKTHDPRRDPGPPLPCLTHPTSQIRTQGVEGYPVTTASLSPGSAPRQTPWSPDVRPNLLFSSEKIRALPEITAVFLNVERMAPPTKVRGSLRALPTLRAPGRGSRVGRRRPRDQRRHLGGPLHPRHRCRCPHSLPPFPERTRGHLGRAGV